MRYISPMYFAKLNSRALLSLSGEDATIFLQGLISNDARKLEKGEAIYATLLSPQGKFLYDFFLVKVSDRIWLDCEAARAEDLRKRLNLYKLRSKVTIEAAPENMAVFAIWGGETIGAIRNATQFTDPRLAALGTRVLGDIGIITEYCAEQSYAASKESDYHAHRLLHGVPLGGVDMIPEKSFLLEWGIDQLHGVDYAKGCYVGQEVTARTHYRGQVRKAPYILKADAPLPDRSPVFCGETEIGEMRSSAGNIGLALLRAEEVAKSASSCMPIRVVDHVVNVAFPSWFVMKEVAAS